MRALSLLSLALAASAMMVASDAKAEAETAGYVESDVRVTVPGHELAPGEIADRIFRTENTAGLRAAWDSGDIGAQADLKLVFWGGSGVSRLSDLTDRRYTDQYRLESDALYIEFYDLMVEGLDLRLGRQIVNWGSADQFNPTSVVNPLDLEDRIKFGDRVANEMAVLTWNTPFEASWIEEVVLQGVVVPVFRTNMIPASGFVVFSDTDLLAQQANSPALESMAQLAGPFETAGGQFNFNVGVDSNLDMATKHAQFGGQFSANVLGVSLAASYFNGYSDIPYVSKITPTVTEPDTGDDSGGSFLDLIQGASLDDLAELGPIIETTDLTGFIVDNEVILRYPKIQMMGGQFSTSLDFLGGMGLWGEVAVFSHDDLALDLDLVSLVGTTESEVTLESGTFTKVAAGIDYSILRNWYVNIQYLRGFVDEFGENNLNQYVVLVNDLKFINETMLVRTVVVHQLEELTGLVYPNIIFSAFEGGELSIGGLVYYGKPETKFGSPVVGPNVAFVKARYSF